MIKKEDPTWVSNQTMWILFSFFKIRISVQLENNSQSSNPIGPKIRKTNHQDLREHFMIKKEVPTWVSNQIMWFSFSKKPEQAYAKPNKVRSGPKILA